MKYDQIPFIPSLIASVVLETVYTGQDISIRLRNQRTVDQVESLRENMSEEDRDEFVRLVDNRCRRAYAAQAEWFMKCVNAKGDKGRDQLYIWVFHWLASYLHDHKKFAD